MSKSNKRPRKTGKPQSSNRPIRSRPQSGRHTGRRGPPSSKMRRIPLADSRVVRQHVKQDLQGSQSMIEPVTRSLCKVLAQDHTILGQPWVKVDIEHGYIASAGFNVAYKAHLDFDKVPSHMWSAIRADLQTQQMLESGGDWYEELTRARHEIRNDDWLGTTSRLNVEGRLDDFFPPDSETGKRKGIVRITHNKEGTVPPEERLKLVRGIEHENWATNILSTIINGHVVNVEQLIEDTVDPYTLPLEKRIEVVRDTAKALLEGHKRGIVHTDIKPSNILARAHKPSVLIDWGLLTLLEPEQLEQLGMQTTQVGQIKGTPLYLAPEQVGINHNDKWQQIRGDVRIDAYQLGATLYQLVTGMDPVATKPSLRSPLEVLGTIMHGGRRQDPLNVRALERLPRTKRDLLRRVKPVIAGCLQFNMDRRYHHTQSTKGQLTMMHIIEDLDSVLSGGEAQHAKALSQRLNTSFSEYCNEPFTAHDQYPEQKRIEPIGTPDENPRFTEAKRRRMGLVGALGLVVASAATTMYFDIADVRTNMERFYIPPIIKYLKSLQGN